MKGVELKNTSPAENVQQQIQPPGSKLLEQPTCSKTPKTKFIKCPMGWYATNLAPGKLLDRMPIYVCGV